MQESPQSAIQPRSQNPTTLATIRDRWDRSVAHVEAAPEGRDLGIAVRLDKQVSGLPCKAELASLADKKLTMLLSGVVRFTAHRNGLEEVVYLDEFVARASDCQLRLVYDRDGIEQALRILENIWA
jgi:hypothetical protein